MTNLMKLLAICQEEKEEVIVMVRLEGGGSGITWSGTPTSCSYTEDLLQITGGNFILELESPIAEDFDDHIEVEADGLTVLFYFDELL